MEGGYVLNAGWQLDKHIIRQIPAPCRSNLFSQRSESKTKRPGAAQLGELQVAERVGKALKLATVNQPETPHRVGFKNQHTWMRGPYNWTSAVSWPMDAGSDCCGLPDIALDHATG